MADTPTYWRFSKEDVAKFGEALRLLGGVPVAVGALLIEDFERLTDVIARIIHDEYHWQTDGIITPECANLCGRAAEAIVARLRAACG